jgi:hypothetical protein
MKPKASVAMRQVDALDAQRRQAHHHARRADRPRPAASGDRRTARPCCVQHRLGVGAHAEEGGVPERDLAR